MKKVYLYVNDLGYLVDSNEQVKDNDLTIASLNDVINYYVEKGQPYEQDGTYLVLREGNYYYDSTSLDYVEVK